MSRQAGWFTGNRRRHYPQGRVDRWLSVADVLQGFTKGEGDGRTLTRLKRERPVQLCREQVDEPQA